jgi:hypothetical protein
MASGSTNVSRFIGVSFDEGPAPRGRRRATGHSRARAAAGACSQPRPEATLSAIAPGRQAKVARLRQ